MTLLFSFTESLQNHPPVKKAAKKETLAATTSSASSASSSSITSSVKAPEKNNVNDINKTLKEKINRTYEIFLNEAVTQIESEIKNQGNNVKDMNADDVQSSAREMAIKKLVEFVDKIVNDETDAINVRAEVKNMAKKEE